MKNIPSSIATATSAMRPFVCKTELSMPRSVSMYSSPREIGDIRRGDEVYLRSCVEATPLRQLAWQQFRDKIGTVGPFIVQSLARGRAVLSVSGGETSLELPLQLLTRDRPVALHRTAFVPSLRGFSFGSESNRVSCVR